MSSRPTPPRFGPRIPLPPAPKERDHGAAGADGLRPGDLLEGRYQIEDRIGEGGVGFVYRALQLKLQRRVAVKLMQRDVIDEAELRPRFQQEALTLAALSHPHIVSLQDYGLYCGRPFLVMELLEGRTLRDMLDVGPLAPVRALTLIRQLLLALAYAHERGVVHRDVKPANLIVQTLPGYEHVKVLDFGMVKLLPGSHLDRGEQITRSGYTIGTPAYMSPEHAIGAEVDGRSDLYAVGVLLFEMLAGKKPFEGEIHDILRHHLTSPVPQLATLAPELAGASELQALIERAMAKERAERFANATELLQAIDGLLMSGRLAHAYEQEAAARVEARPGLQNAFARSLGVLQRYTGRWRAISPSRAGQRPEPAAVSAADSPSPSPALPAASVVPGARARLARSLGALGRALWHLPKRLWLRLLPWLAALGRAVAAAGRAVAAAARAGGRGVRTRLWPGLANGTRFLVRATSRRIRGQLIPGVYGRLARLGRAAANAVMGLVGRAQRAFGATFRSFQRLSLARLSEAANAGEGDTIVDLPPRLVPAPISETDIPTLGVVDRDEEPPTALASGSTQTADPLVLAQREARRPR